jgi:uncharacterized membrane protein
MIGALLSAMMIVAISAPIVAAFVGMRLRSSTAIAVVPGLLLAVAALGSLATAWGGRTTATSDDVSNTGALLVAAILALGAGAMGVCVASVVTRVRRGPGWSRRA